ncbi:hypothetical protein [Demetria terragena]|uniref:hypothetical protein n=1 Tax=Demetria terragena TaxID=63959 RepID=UPI000365C490|nr:hypothetical protein [Demetria terragena]
MATNIKTVDYSAGIALILPGIALTLVSARFDGFVKGACQGAGIMMLLIGVYLIAARMRKPAARADTDGMWLPSRDGDASHDDTPRDDAR